MTYSTPKVPSTGDWKYVGDIHVCGAEKAMAWRHTSGVCVLSAVEIAELGKPEYHLSVSFRGVSFLEKHVPTAEQMTMVRRAFGIEDAEEDNHGPGVCRHLWMTVSPNDREIDCHCKNEAPPFKDGEREWRP